ncbi:hypothetical protein [Hippea sp. KM1]|uniref:hypothetical protein n=1 Tax=Hippea sp. KM1 TaxID=944481 RepID=UPI0004AD3079|nr:hypothetical protein [Hippea sp. KM1]
MEAEANLFGVKSKGLFQVRGNGKLILTEKALIFRPYDFKKDIFINVKEIKTVQLRLSFLGKTVFRKILTISTATDEVGWLVKDPQKWKAAIEKLMA